MSYRALALPGSEVMSPALLRKLEELAEKGALIVGNRPLKAPGLTGYPACDEEVQRRADRLWGSDRIAPVVLYRTEREVTRLTRNGRTLRHGSLSPDVSPARNPDRPLAQGLS